MTPKKEDAQLQIERGERFTATLISECNRRLAIQEMTADTMAKALLAAATSLGLASAPPGKVCGWLRGVAAELEHRALTTPRRTVN